ncbi:MAG: hypothetical protein AAB416_04385 [Patescibacteria group bacterium]
MGDHPPSARGQRAFVSQAQAIERLGQSAVVTVEQARAFWESEEEMYRVDSVPFSVENLSRCAKENERGHQWRLVWVLGLKPLQIVCKIRMPSRLMTPMTGSLSGPDTIVIMEKFEPTFCMGGANFIIKAANEQWAFGSQRRGWRLIDFKPRFPRLNWNQQEALLASESPVLTRAHDRDVLEAMFVIAGTTGEDLLAYHSHWGYPRAKEANPIIIGTNSEGVYVISTFPETVEFYDWLGVCAEIAPET